MNEESLINIANNANMIVKGYAFTRNEDFIQILNLNDGKSSMIIDYDGTMLATNMDEIEQVIVKNIWHRDSKYMEAYSA